MNKFFLFIIFTLVIFDIQSVNAQPQINNHYDYNDVTNLRFVNDTMWMATTGGVCYRIAADGFTAPHILPIDVTLFSRFITNIEVNNFNNEGTKWFGTFDRGVASYNDGNWTYYNSTNSIVHDLIHSLAVDSSGNVWAGTPEGAFRFDGANWTQFNDNTNVMGDVRSISVSGDSIWFGTFGNGLYLFDGTNWSNLMTTNNGNSLANITTLEARRDTIMVGTDWGITFYDPAIPGWTPYSLTNNEVLDIEFGLYDIYAATNQGLLYWFNATWDPSFMTFTHNRLAAIETEGFSLWAGFGKLGGGIERSTGSIPDTYVITGSTYPGKNDISDITSNNNFVYVATNGNGVTIYDGTGWETHDMSYGLNNLFINSLSMQIDTLWAATNGGVYSYDGEIWQLHTSETDTTKAIAVDGNDINRVWCGTTDSVFTLYEGIYERSYKVADGLLQNNVIKIVVDSNNDVWFLHPNGLTQLSGVGAGATFTTLTPDNLGISGAILHDIEADNFSSIWVTSTNGIVEYNSVYVNHYTTADGLAENDVLCVAIDKNRQLLYFGTPNSGMSLRGDNRWQNITQENGLATNKITAIHFQETGSFIWSGGNWGGISQTHIPPLSVQATVSPADYVCPGENITLFADVTGGFGTDSYNYSWTSTDVNFTSNNPSENYIIDTLTLFSLDVNDGFYQGGSDIWVYVNEIFPSDILGPDTICPNGDILNYYVADMGDRTYNWTANGGVIVSDAYQSQVDVSWYTDVINGSLFLTETDNSTLCSTTQQFEVNILVDIIPEIVLKNGNNILICLDSGMVNYQWYLNDIMIPGANNQFYYLDENLGSINGTYHVEFDLGGTCRLISNSIDINRTLMKAYPQPTQNEFNIDISDDNISEGFVLIKDIYGKQIESVPFTKQNIFKHININVSDYKPGIYFYSIYLGDKKVNSGKLIID